MPSLFPLRHISPFSQRPRGRLEGVNTTKPRMTDELGGAVRHAGGKRRTRLETAPFSPQSGFFVAGGLHARRPYCRLLLTPPPPPSSSSQALLTSCDAPPPLTGGGLQRVRVGIGKGRLIFTVTVLPNIRYSCSCEHFTELDLKGKHLHR